MRKLTERNFRDRRTPPLGIQGHDAAIKRTGKYLQRVPKAWVG